MARVVSFEISSQNPERAVQFYQNVFGWEFGTPQWDYWPVTTGSVAQPGINGGIDRGPADFPHGTRILIEVDDIDSALKKAISEGARVLREKMEFDTFYLAYFIDPTGIAIGLTQNKG